MPKSQFIHFKKLSNSSGRNCLEPTCKSDKKTAKPSLSDFLSSLYNGISGD